MTKIKTTIAANKVRAIEIYDRFLAEYPDAKCSLDHRTPLELIVATILSAQCTDARVNKITPELFARFKTAEDYAEAPLKEIESYVKTCGFYRNKAKNIQGMARALIEWHGGEVPGTLEELTALDGVGRKTANVVLGSCFDVPGVVVDTHCGRIARRLGFTKNTDPVKVERDLMKVWRHEDWSLFSHFMVFHGRASCMARAPMCSECCVRDLCPFPETREGKKIAK